MKALAKLQPIAAMAEDPTLRFDFPSPTELKPPLVTLDMAAVGYEPGKPVLARINLRLDPDDRVALLGRNGNGKTTQAPLLAAQLQAMEGSIANGGKMRVGYFSQYQAEQHDTEDTPLEPQRRMREDANQPAVGAHLGGVRCSGEEG